MSEVQSSEPRTHGVFNAESNVQEQIVRELQRSDYDEIKKVSCSVQAGVAILRGHVRSFYLKQMAQTIVRKIGGVTEIDNRLTVVNPAIS